MEQTYSVIRHSPSRMTTGPIARGIDSLAAAAETALRLTRLQEQELGGDDDFYTEAE